MGLFAGRACPQSTYVYFAQVSIFYVLAYYYYLQPMDKHLQIISSIEFSESSKVKGNGVPYKFIENWTVRPTILGL